MYTEAPLNHGQLYSRREIESYPHGCLPEANLSISCGVSGLSTERVMATLRRLGARHETLRTTYHLRDGEPVQRIHDDVALPVEFLDRAPGGPDEEERTTAELAARPFPLTGALGWRAVLVGDNGAPRFLSFAFSHLIVDVWSIHELAAQFSALIADPDAEPPDGPSPRELARRQRGEHGGRRQRAAERHWARVLGDDLAHHFPTLPTGVRQERIQATLYSHRLGGLATKAAERHGVTAPAVLMAMLAGALSEHLGAERVPMSLMYSNRLVRDHKHAVGTLNQLVPVVALVDHRAALGEHISRLHWLCAKAYLHSSYDVDRIAALSALTGATRAHDGWFNQLFPCWFNYLQLDQQASDPDDRRAAELVWTPRARPFGQPVDVRVSVRDGRTALALRTDPSVVDETALTGILRSVALGTQRALTEPSSTLKDLWSAPAKVVAPTLFPAEIPSR